MKVLRVERPKEPEFKPIILEIKIESEHDLGIIKAICYLTVTIPNKAFSDERVPHAYTEGFLAELRRVAL